MSCISLNYQTHKVVVSKTLEIELHHTDESRTYNTFVEIDYIEFVNEGSNVSFYIISTDRNVHDKQVIASRFRACLFKPAKLNDYKSIKKMIYKCIFEASHDLPKLSIGDRPGFVNETCELVMDELEQNNFILNNKENKND